jgi:hypothetical protein
MPPAALAAHLLLFAPCQPELAHIGAPQTVLTAVGIEQSVLSSAAAVCPDSQHTGGNVVRMLQHGICAWPALQRLLSHGGSDTGPGSFQVCS